MKPNQNQNQNKHKTKQEQKNRKQNIKKTTPLLKQIYLCVEVFCALLKGEEKQEMCSVYISEIKNDSEIKNEFKMTLGLSI